MSCGVGLLARSRQEFRQRGVLVDVVAAAALLTGALASLVGLASDRAVAVSFASAVVCTTAVAWRRWSPVLAALVALTAVVIYQVSSRDEQGAFVSLTLVLTSYSVGRLVVDERRRWRVVAVAAYALGACTLINVDSGFSVGADLLTWIPLAVVPIIAGQLVARRQRTVDQLRDVQSRLCDEEQVERERVLAEERARVARELHDVVAHCVSVMVIQASAARLLLAEDVAVAREALQVVASSGREALADLRRVVGVRRRCEQEQAGWPGLAQVEPLVQRLRTAGLDVHLSLPSVIASLPADLDLTAFRVVQEALTNVGKHAPSARVAVTVRYNDAALDIRVDDTGPASGSSRLDHTGHGLVGMRERISLHGGTLQTGPTAVGGYTVHARIPNGRTQAPTADASGSALLARSGVSRLPTLTAPRLDMLFSGAWLVALETDAVTSSHRSGPITLNIVAVAIMAAVGAVRRRAPFLFLVVVGAGTIALSGGIARPDRVTVVGFYTVFVCSYTIAAYRDRRAAVAGLVVLLAGVVASTVLQHAGPGVALGGGLMTCVVWLAGRVMRRHRELVAELEHATARLIAERDSRALLALYDERAWIARDLHALIARLVTVMVIQAEAAGDMLVPRPGAALDTICAIEQTGRDTLVQMRQMLGVLRSINDPPPLRPPLQAQLPTTSPLAAVPS